MLEFRVSNNLSPLPLKHFLRQYAGLSLTLWRKTKHLGTIMVNDELSQPNHIVHPGDKIVITWPQDSHILPQKIPLSICYEDTDLIIVNKPSGMLAHPCRNEDSGTLANAILAYYQENNLTYGFHPVHRLDRNTSGLLVIAKNPHIQHLLSYSHNKPLRRYYLAITDGSITETVGSICFPISRKPSSIIEREVSPHGQPSITHYRVLRRFKNATLIEAHLETGRTHQVRVHFSYLGHPLQGDDLYGGSQELISRQALHAYKITFFHPITEQYYQVVAPLPDDIKSLIKQLRHH